MMKIILALLLCLVSIDASAAGRESAYNRVTKTQTLRCGYGVWEPMIHKDANTGELSGIFVDIMKEIGKVTGLKIEFVEEVDWGNIPTALSSGRIDAMCAGMWGTAKRGMQMAFSPPLFYSVIQAYTKSGDTRFDNALEKMNDPSIKLSVNDGDVSLEIADRLFPKAARISKIQLAGEDFLLMNVTSGKADVTFTTPSIAKAFLEKNPNSIRQVKTASPLGINQNVIGVDIREQELQDLLTAAVQEIKYNGVIERIFSARNAEDVADFTLSIKE